MVTYSNARLAIEFIGWLGGASRCIILPFGWSVSLTCEHLWVKGSTVYLLAVLRTVALPGGGVDERWVTPDGAEFSDVILSVNTAAA